VKETIHGPDFGKAPWLRAFIKQKFAPNLFFMIPIGYHGKNRK
jgi:hypothetical protein